MVKNDSDLPGEIREAQASSLIELAMIIKHGRCYEDDGGVAKASLPSVRIMRSEVN